MNNKKRNSSSLSNEYHVDSGTMFDGSSVNSEDVFEVFAATFSCNEALGMNVHNAGGLLLPQSGSNSTSNSTSNSSNNSNNSISNIPCILGNTSITSVTPHGQAWKKGAKRDDFIIGVDGLYVAWNEHSAVVEALKQAKNRAKAHKDQQPLVITFARVNPLCLMTVAQDEFAPIKTGRLWKQSTRFMVVDWSSTRQFVLSRSGISWTGNSGSKRHISSHEIREVQRKLGKDNELTVTLDGDKPLELKTENERDCLAWLHAIECVRRGSFNLTDHTFDSLVQHFFPAGQPQQQQQGGGGGGGYQGQRHHGASTTGTRSQQNVPPDSRSNSANVPARHHSNYSYVSSATTDRPPPPFPSRSSSSSSSDRPPPLPPRLNSRGNSGLSASVVAARARSKSHYWMTAFCDVKINSPHGLHSSNFKNKDKDKDKGNRNHMSDADIERTVSEALQQPYG